MAMQRTPKMSDTAKLVDCSVLVIIQHLSAVGQAWNQSDSGQVCQLIGGLISGLSMCPWARLQLLVSYWA